MADGILTAVIEGSFVAGSALPSEGELALRYGMSRLTVREAIRILRSQGVLEIRRGRGTFVNVPDRWTSLEAIVRAEHHRDPSSGVSEKLLEARRMVEVGAAQLAAARRSEEDLDELASCMQEMAAGHDSGDVDLFVEADIAFHAVIMRASGNIFVPFMFEPFGELLTHTRRQTSTLPVIQANAIREHAAIAEALRAGDADAARGAMESHMDQTRDDLRHHVLEAATGGAGDPFAAPPPPSRSAVR
nr:FadR/GntR family transcriptional regulator [Nakamurella flavida]